MRTFSLPAEWPLASRQRAAAGVAVAVVALALLAAAAVSPRADYAQLAQLVVNGVITGSILALAGVGATLIFGIQRIANFAHGDFLTIGAYAAFVVNGVLGQNLALSAVGAMAAVALFAVVAHFVLFRPLRGRGTVALALISVGLGLVIRNAIAIVAGSEIRRFDVSQSDVIELGVVRLSPGQAVAIAVAVIVAPLVGLFLARTRVGKRMRAVADNRDLAAVAGIDIERIAVYVWILAGALAGLAGVMLGLEQGTFDPNMGVGPLFLIFTAVVLGGIGSAYGALVAGLALGLAMELSTWDGFFGGLDAKYKPVLAFVVLILLLLYRPQGLFGRARIL
ncbi:MAG TPA: branched-chain amino acid ABC transporter permease [Thermomicrobiales bacterium]|nr:branched-chain amino acid ABC transporter permease [Thermomicrobiales bacterium]